MQKKSWTITLLATGFMIFLILGITSARAVESVSIADILNNPPAYEGVEVEVTGTLIAIDHGLLLEDASGAQILVHAGPLWYMESPDGLGVDLEVGDVITVVGIVCTVSNPQDQSFAYLAALTIDGVTLREDVAVRPTWAGGYAHQECGQHRSHGQNQQNGRAWTDPDVVAGLCGGGSLTGLAAYGFRRI